MMNSTATADLAQTECREWILTVRINRPEKKNALNTVMYGALADALQRADEDPSIRVVLLCGCDDCFTSGNDIADFDNFPPTGPDSPVLRFLDAITLDSCRLRDVPLLNQTRIYILSYRRAAPISRNYLLRSPHLCH